MSCSSLCHWVGSRQRRTRSNAKDQPYGGRGHPYHDQPDKRSRTDPSGRRSFRLTCIEGRLGTLAGSRDVCAKADAPRRTARAMTSIGALTLSGGWWIFAIFLVVFFLAIVFGYYTRRGSGINLRPWHPRGTSAEGSPPSLSHDISQDVRNWTRGTRAGRRRRRLARYRPGIRARSRAPRRTSPESPGRRPGSRG